MYWSRCIGDDAIVQVHWCSGKSLMVQVSLLRCSVAGAVMQVPLFRCSGACPLFKCIVTGANIQVQWCRYIVAPDAVVKFPNKQVYRRGVSGVQYLVLCTVPCPV